MTILIVDDDDDFREVVVDLLTEEGFVTATASNGSQALRMLRRQGFRACLVLLDVVMPVMDGWEVLRRLSADGTLAHTPVAIVTAHAAMRDIARRNFGRSTTFLTKPIKLNRILDVADEFCERRKPSDPA
jgi:CheY-like chemotaxis protein